MSNNYLSSEELSLRIALIFEGAKDAEFTRGQIAKQLKYKSVRTVTIVLDHMVASGYLSRTPIGRPQGGVKYIYRKTGCTRLDLSVWRGYSTELQSD